MEKILNRIKKLLRLSLSDSPYEASLAAKKAVELMEKYSISKNDLKEQPIIIKEIEVEYARIPRWLKTLYINISYLNGCYMIYQNGRKDGNKFLIKAKIIITGLKSDVENIDYYVQVLKKEILKKAEFFKKNIDSNREVVKSYKMGLSDGVYNILYKASQNFNKNIKDNALVPIETKYKEAKEFCLSKYDVDEVASNFKKNIHYLRGFGDAKTITLSRPIEQNRKSNILAIEVK